VPRLQGLLLAIALLACGGMLFGRLAHPLLWQDEGETAMFATHVLAYGYPKVHGDRNVVYEFGPNIALGVDEATDAYLGKTWGDFYFAVPGLVWARGASDPYARTFRLRLPFALAGAAGLVAMLWAVLPAVPRGRRIGFAAAFAALASVSISLLLHLREVRYYPLLVLVMGALLGLHVRRLLWPRDRIAGHAIATGALSFLLFQVFHVAWFAATALLAADSAYAVWRAEARDGRARKLARELAPHLVGALLVLPWIVFLETFQVARGFAAHVGVSVAGWLGNAGFVLAHFARHELLVPALACRAAVAWQRRGAGGAAPASSRVSARLLGFCAGYAALGCINPLVYERYFVVLSPLVTLACLLDAHALVDAARRPRRTAVALAALVAIALAPRAATVWGRVTELRSPVRGPVDFAVAHLRERYPDPAALVIATNYEAHPLMYYLGSRVIVGLSGNDLARERGLVPDVVIPRRAWPRTLPQLRRYLSRGSYREELLPVEDTRYNNIPSVSASKATPDPHRFATPAAGPADPARLRMYHRIQ
jgi:hypothetical protein